MCLHIHPEHCPQMYAKCCQSGPSSFRIPVPKAPQPGEEAAGRECSSWGKGQIHPAVGSKPKTGALKAASALAREGTGGCQSHTGQGQMNQGPALAPSRCHEGVFGKRKPSQEARAGLTKQGRSL